MSKISLFTTWMIHLIKRILLEDKNNIFKINLYFTATQQKYDLRAFFLWHGLDLLKAENNNLLNGYYENIYWGRPDWKKLILEKRKSYKEEKTKCGVFVLCKLCFM